MSLATLRADLAERVRLLRRGGLLRLGPLALMRTPHALDLLSRLRRAESELDEAELASFPLPAARAAAKQPRSVVFLHNAYYNFFYLAAALRRRGWDALAVSLHDPAGAETRYYHGEDRSLFDPDPARLRRNVDDFFREVRARFRMVHFYGRGHMSFYPDLFDRGPTYESLPADFVKLRQLGIKIGYSVCGCLDGVAQSSVHAWSGGACDRCVWQIEPRICGDRGNLAWGSKLHMFCDLVATEGFPALDWQSGEKVYREPLSTALDPDFWRPDLEVPPKYRLPRSPGELIVYHGFGNHALRARNGRDIKGTGAVRAAIDRLRRDGVNVRLEFCSDVPNTEVRFIQVQADVIVDQLNYGRYGAQAREGMMLGRPTICHINQGEPAGQRALESIRTCPLVSASEESLYGVLKDLLANEERRRAIGQASRAFALKWHSADACAARFEQVYDRLLQGLPPEPALVSAA